MRPLGALRDPAGKERGEPLHSLVAASRSTLPEAYDLRGPRTRYPDQNGSSCEGHAYAQAIRTLSKGAIDPAAMAIYGVGRQVGAPYAPYLADGGAYTNRILEGMEEFGLVARGRWPDGVDPTERVPEDVIEAGSLAVETKSYRIWETGEALPLAIRRTVASGYPVPYAQDVDRGYMLHRGSVPWRGLTGGIEGSHAQCIVAYRPDAVGVAGSWGTGWAEDGFVWIAWEFFATPHVYDVQVITATPTRVW